MASRRHVASHVAKQTDFSPQESLSLYIYMKSGTDLEGSTNPGMPEARPGLSPAEELEMRVGLRTHT